MTSSKLCAVALLTLAIGSVQATPLTDAMLANGPLQAPVIAHWVNKNGGVVAFTNFHGTCVDNRAFYATDDAGNVVDEGCWNADAQWLYMNDGSERRFFLAEQDKAFIDAIRR